jgi:hypothetical protein
VKGHGKQAFRCGGCNKAFSRRDAIKRHQERARRPGQACRDAEVEEIDVEAQRNHRKGRNCSLQFPLDDDRLEQGELPPEMIARAQTTILAFHPVLQQHLAHALGNSPHTNAMSAQSFAIDPALMPPSDPTGSAQAIGLSAEQAFLVEQAIAMAASAAQAQAEAEALLEEDEDAEFDDDELNVNVDVDG